MTVFADFKWSAAKKPPCVFAHVFPHVCVCVYLCLCTGLFLPLITFLCESRRLPWEVVVVVVVLVVGVVVVVVGGGRVRMNEEEKKIPRVLLSPWLLQEVQ